MWLLALILAATAFGMYVVLRSIENPPISVEYDESTKAWRDTPP